MILLMSIFNLPQTGDSTSSAGSAALVLQTEAVQLFIAVVFSVLIMSSISLQACSAEVVLCYGTVAACNAPAQISSISIPTLTFVT